MKPPKLIEIGRVDRRDEALHVAQELKFFAMRAEGEVVLSKKLEFQPEPSA